MRLEKTLRMFEDFYDLSGLSGVFTGCTCYLANGFYYSRMGRTWSSEGDRQSVEGTPRDVEGMQQQGWTIFTVVVLKHLCELNQIIC